MADQKIKISSLSLWTPLNTDIIPYVDLVTNTTKKAYKSELKWDKWDTWDTWATGATWPQWPQGEQWEQGIQWEQWEQGIQWIQGETWPAWADWLDITWLWAYNWATSYVINDAISYLWSSYICKLASTGNLPTNATYFDLMAQKWDDWAWSWDMLKSVYDPAWWEKQVAFAELTNLASTDLNTITDNGFYCANSTCTNLPESWVKTRLRVNQDPSNSDLAMQEALTTTTLVSYVRTTANGWTTWTSWARIKATDETKALDTAVVKITWEQTITWTKTFTNTAIIKNTTTWEAVLDLDSNLSRTRFFYRESDGTFWMYDWNNTFLRWLNDASATPNTMWITDWASSVNNSSALLSLWSTTKWFAPPRMTTAQRDAISSPLTWLIVYNTTLNTLDRYNGTDWHSFVDTWTTQTIAWVKTFTSPILSNSVRLTEANAAQWEVHSDLSVIVRAATTANITLSGTPTIDWQVLVANDLVLVKNQSTWSQNGVYVVNAGAWTRSTNYNTTDHFNRRYIYVISGTANTATLWICSTRNPTVWTTATSFSQISLWIGTAANQAAAGNHNHTSIATTAASSFGAALSYRYANRTATWSTAATDLVVEFTWSTASQIETMPDWVALSNNSWRIITYKNSSSNPWTIRQSASNTLDGSSSDYTLAIWETLTVLNKADNVWISLNKPEVTASSTNTLTNKRITKRVVTTTQSATPTINTNNWDIFNITWLAQAITSMTTNLTWTPVDWDMMIINITDNGTARAITWGASFEASTIALPTTTTISTLLKVWFMWNTATSKWRCVAVA